MKKYQEASDEKERQNLRDDRVDSFSRTGGRHRGLRHDVRQKRRGKGGKALRRRNDGQRV